MEVLVLVRASLPEIVVILTVRTLSRRRLVHLYNSAHVFHSVSTLATPNDLSICHSLHVEGSSRARSARTGTPVGRSYAHNIVFLRESHHPISGYYYTALNIINTVWQ